MPLPTVNAGDQILATDINNHITQTNTNTTNIATNTSNITTAQHQLNQPGGGSESGGYFLAGNAPLDHSVVSDYIAVTSRGNTINSISIDTSNQSPTGGAGSPSTGNYSGSGFQCFFFTSGTDNTNARCGGNWTAHFALLLLTTPLPLLLMLIGHALRLL